MVRQLRKLIDGYEEWKQFELAKKYPHLILPLPGDIIPVSYSYYALQAINLRGGAQHKQFIKDLLYKYLINVMVEHFKKNTPPWLRNVIVRLILRYRDKDTAPLVDVIIAGLI